MYLREGRPVASATLKTARSLTLENVAFPPQGAAPAGSNILQMRTDVIDDGWHLFVI